MIKWGEVILGLLGGLGIFLYGMQLMSDSLQRVAGEKLRKIMAVLTRNKFTGVIVGTVVTGIIQSSSATTVMLVGFVNAGIMTFSQTIGVIMGANIGTTVTAQIIAFNIIHYAPIMIAVGAFFSLFVKNKKWKLYGESLLGLGFLFFGIHLMSLGVNPLRGHESVVNAFKLFSSNPATGILAGLAITCILQSSSATVGLAQVLAMQGLIDFNGAVALILGDNIGTTITAQLAAINASRASRRTAMAHTMFNVIGVIIFFPFVYMKLYQKLIIFITPGDPANLKHVAHFIANAHTGFNVINTIIFFNFTQVLEKISNLLVPVKAEEKREAPNLLEPHLLDTPAIALQLVQKELVHMVEVAERAVKTATKALLTYDSKTAEDVHGIEDTTDEFQYAITEYLIRISERELTPAESEQLPTLMHSVNDLERVGDHAENLAEIVETMQMKRIKFSEEALLSLREMTELMEGMFPPLKRSIDQSDPQAAIEVLAIERRVNILRKKLDEEHIERLKSGVCLLPAASFFLDAVHNMEKVGDHMKNIAQTAHNFFLWSRGKTKLPKENMKDVGK